MKEEELNMIKARCALATLGPWEKTLHSENYGQGYGTVTYFVKMPDELLKIGLAEDSKFCTKYDRDADFIAHARTDIPALLAEVERLTRERDVLVAHLRVHSDANCVFCKNYNPSDECLCGDCNEQSHWTWCGAQEGE